MIVGVYTIAFAVTAAGGDLKRIREACEAEVRAAAAAKKAKKKAAPAKASKSKPTAGKPVPKLKKAATAAKPGKKKAAPAKPSKASKSSKAAAVSSSTAD